MIDYSEIDRHSDLFDALLGPEQSINREIRFDYDVGRDPRPDSLRPGREFFRVQITTHNANHNPIRFSWFYHSDRDRKKWHMSSLSFRGLGLLMIKEKFLSHLINLEYIDLQGNQLKNINLEALQCYQSLHTINLSSNKLSNLSLEPCVKFSQLKYLSLFNNNITHLDLLPLKESLLLERISFSQNKIAQINLKPLKNLNYLLTIDLSHNQLKNLDLHLQNLRLSSLILNDNKLSQIFFTHSFLPNLSLFMLSNNRLAEFNADNIITHFPNLKRLYLWGNKIKNFNWPQQCHHFILEEINLNSNLLQKLHVEGDYTELIHLETAYNNISTVNLQNFYAPNIQSINLSFNPIKTIQLPNLSNFPMLSWLDLAGCDLTILEINSELPILNNKMVKVGNYQCKQIQIGELKIQIPNKTILKKK